ncbi:uncharacterized protein LOC119729164 [Patiria miniata]|uniref:Uncharacterized protein n=1 Tax=Patiria miniata TaxID=46514 RepID=A0A914A1B7_PATMI|nr:uncharacterized protein LOC119729164 [Patiria miniata]
MESNVTLTTMETPSSTKEKTNYYLAIASLCIGVINTVAVIAMLIWLRRHPKLRGEPNSSKAKKAKPSSPKKILTIDYRMSELDDESENCPQRQGTFAIGQPLPQEGGRASAHVHHRGDGEDRDNPSFTAAPEILAQSSVYENTRFPP